MKRSQSELNEVEKKLYELESQPPSRIKDDTMEKLFASQKNLIFDIGEMQEAREVLEEEDAMEAFYEEDPWRKDEMPVLVDRPGSRRSGKASFHGLEQVAPLRDRRKVYNRPAREERYRQRDRGDFDPDRDTVSSMRTSNPMSQRMPVAVPMKGKNPYTVNCGP